MCLIRDRLAIRNEPLRIAAIRLGMHGQHLVQHRRARDRIAGVRIVEDVAAEEILPRDVDRIGRGIRRAVLLDHRDVFLIARIGHDLLLHRGEGELDLVDIRLRHVHGLSTLKHRILLDELARVLEVVRDLLPAIAPAFQLAHGVNGRVNDGVGIIRCLILVALLHEVLRVDVAIRRVQVVGIAIAAIEREHLVQAARAIGTTLAAEVSGLLVIERLGEAALNLLRGNGKRLRRIGLAGKDVAIALLGIAQGDQLLNLREHFLSRGLHIRRRIRVVGGRHGLLLERLHDIRHADHGCVRVLHPRDSRTDVRLILIILAVRDVVAQILRIIHRVIGRTMQLHAIALLHELTLALVCGVELFLVVIDILRTGNAQ